MKHHPRTPAGVTVHVKGKNMVIPPKLHDQIVAKMVRLDKYHDKLQAIEVELSTEKARSAEHKNRAEATTHVTGRTVRVTAANADMQAAVDACVDKLYRQLNRQKERLKAHHGNAPAEISDFEPSAFSGPFSEEDGDQGSDFEPVVLVEQLEMKPQFEDEAVEELQLNGGNFHVFLNARNEQVNVLYRHHDGTYGLIEPRSG